MAEEVPQEQFDEVREQDRFLPIANISRIMKRSLPENAKIAKDAKETVQECVSEFISFITSEASDKCQQEKRKTINGDDLLWAMSTLGFDKYVEPLKLYLAKYRESVKGEKPEKRSRRDMDAGDALATQPHMPPAHHAAAAMMQHPPMQQQQPAGSPLFAPPVVGGGGSGGLPMPPANQMVGGGPSVAVGAPAPPLGTEVDAAAQPRT
mmetsp:Transcript_8406/g.12824  ORF Transcript_8406/g.12824 Transcript_8406/m.12824 type:complete len:208 (+) Transcript_8406:233-856(+)